MRGGSTRQRRHEEEEESVFVSMTDMTVGFLFIVILLLAFFASQYNPSEMVSRSEYEEIVAERDNLTEQIERLEDLIAELRRQLTEMTAERDAEKSKGLELSARISALKAELERLRQPNPLESYIRDSRDARRRILEQLRDLIAGEFPGLRLVLSEESLRFQGEGLFDRGSPTIKQSSLPLVRVVADRLQQILPCYTLGAQKAFAADCNGGFALIEAVQIEGHTDSDGEDMSNLALSASRATNTFREMIQHRTSLIDHQNFRGQSVLSVSGYGRMRPVAENDTAENKASNRRIDLRIIMHVPQDTQEIEAVRSTLLGEAARGVE